MKRELAQYPKSGSIFFLEETISLCLLTKMERRENHEKKTEDSLQGSIGHSGLCRFAGRMR
ncbi:MAG: hypothetical protein KH202_08950 [Clostridiales bacterium]|nr:hypothetical protein [Clostridiales bacterium]